MSAENIERKKTSPIKATRFAGALLTAGMVGGGVAFAGVAPATAQTEEVRATVSVGDQIQTTEDTVALNMNDEYVEIPAGSVHTVIDLQESGGPIPGVWLEIDGVELNIGNRGWVIYEGEDEDGSSDDDENGDEGEDTPPEDNDGDNGDGSEDGTGEDENGSDDGSGDENGTGEDENGSDDEDEADVQPTGSLEITNGSEFRNGAFIDADRVELNYSTNSPDDLNYVAFFPADAPEPPNWADAWGSVEYASDAEGTVSIGITPNQPAGEYRVEFLTYDNDERLADPVYFTVIDREDEDGDEDEDENGNGDEGEDTPPEDNDGDNGDGSEDGTGEDENGSDDGSEDENGTGDEDEDENGSGDEDEAEVVEPALTVDPSEIELDDFVGDSDESGVLHSIEGAEAGTSIEYTVVGPENIRDFTGSTIVDDEGEAEFVIRGFDISGPEAYLGDYTTTAVLEDEEGESFELDAEFSVIDSSSSDDEDDDDDDSDDNGSGSGDDENGDENGSSDGDGSGSGSGDGSGSGSDDDSDGSSDGSGSGEGTSEDDEDGTSDDEEGTSDKEATEDGTSDEETSKEESASSDKQGSEAAGSSKEQSSTSDELAKTGATTTQAGIIFGFLVALGAGFVAFANRTRLAAVFSRKNN